MSHHDDRIVLGAGSRGGHSAAALAAGGLRVVVLERELVGAKCSYVRCVPSNTLLRPGEAVHGAREACLAAADGLEPTAGDWLQQATLAVRARIPLGALRDTIQPFTLSEIYVPARKALGAAVRQPVGASAS
jgi:pyruvate/2-oxoglutarate dehydrogenase complex dihydrolipoamide dehydrogenase (E3) component